MASAQCNILNLHCNYKISFNKLTAIFLNLTFGNKPIVGLAVANELA